MTLNFAKHTFISSSVLLSLTYSSFALDADTFGDRFKKAFSDDGIKVEFELIKVDSDNVKLEDTKFTSAGETLSIESIQFNGIVEHDDGTLGISKTILGDINHQIKAANFTVTGIEIDGLRLPAENADDPAYSYVVYERVISGPATYTKNGIDIFKIANSELTLDAEENLQSIKFDGSINGLVIDRSIIKNPRVQRAIGSMGYSSIEGNIQMNGKWDAETGRFFLPELEFTLNDAGTINIALDVSGYSYKLNKQRQKARKQATSMAGLGLMQQLTLNALSIRFDDASLTERVLEFAGSQQGMSAEQMAQAAKAFLPFVLARLGMPELQQQITVAASAYLDNPQNIEIKASPPAPVPFGQVMGAAMADPRSIPATIGVEVLANQ